MNETTQAPEALTSTGVPLPKLGRGGLTPSQRNIEYIIETILFLAAVSSVVVTTAIVAILIVESFPFFAKVSLGEFLFETQWTPTFDVKKYGILALVCGTLGTTIVSLLVAVPMGTVAAIYLSEYCPHGAREILKPMLELLAAILTIVYGYFAVVTVAPALQWLMSQVGYDLGAQSMSCAGLVMGIMIIPYVCSLSEDAMRSVPMQMREGAYACGATKFQTATRVVFPAALSGISAAYILGISRAIGETMIVALAGGGQANFTLNPLQDAQTITAFITTVSKGDLEHGSVGYQSVFAAGLTLFVLTLGFNVMGYWLRQRYREAY